MKRPMDTGDIAFSTVFNFRDLGGFEVRGGGITSHRTVFRSDALQRVDAADQAVLEGLGLRAVFDLRSAAELETDGLGSFVGGGVPHFHVPMMAVTLNPYDSSVDWRGIDLEERYVAMLEEGQTAIRAVLEAVAEPQPGGVVFHCSAGKDRTGVLAAVLLGAVGVHEEAIVADYAASAANIERVIEGYREEMLAAGLDEAAIAYLISSPPERIRYMLAQLEGRWGNIDGYLDAIGFDADCRRRLRSRFVASGV
jgi:protein-tyrosine phosphatase